MKYISDKLIFGEDAFKNRITTLLTSFFMLLLLLYSQKSKMGYLDITLEFGFKAFDIHTSTINDFFIYCALNIFLLLLILFLIVEISLFIKKK